MQAEDVAVASLLPKLEGWLKQQPEWPLLFLSTRNVRRRAAKAIAQALCSIPTSEPGPGMPSRSVRRAIERELFKR